jgi:hypothetical protein
MGFEANNHEAVGKNIVDRIPTQHVVFMHSCKFIGKISLELIAGSVWQRLNTRGHSYRKHM